MLFRFHQCYNTKVVPKFVIIAPVKVQRHIHLASRSNSTSQLLDPALDFMLALWAAKHFLMLILCQLEIFTAAVFTRGGTSSTPSSSSLAEAAQQKQLLYLFINCFLPGWIGIGLLQRDGCATSLQRALPWVVAALEKCGCVSLQPPPIQNGNSGPTWYLDLKWKNQKNNDEMLKGVLVDAQRASERCGTRSHCSGTTVCSSLRISLVVSDCRPPSHSHSLTHCLPPMRNK